MQEMGFRDFRRVQEEMERSVDQETYHRLFFPQRPGADTDTMPEPQEAHFDLGRQLCQPIDSEKAGKAEEAGFFDSGDSCPWPRIQTDENGEPEFVPTPQLRKRSRKPLNKKQRERERERRKKHHTKAWFERELLAVANGERVMTQQQYRALIEFGRIRGWHRGPPDKKPSRNRFLR